MSYNPAGFLAVQVGSITIGAGAASNTATLSPAVDVTNTVLVWAGTSTTDNTNNSVNDGSLALLTLTSSTVVTATRGGSSAFATTIKFVALQYKPGTLKSLQYFTMAGAGATHTITSVDVTRSYVACLGEYGPNGDAAGLAAGFGTLVLTNATTVTSAGGTASSVIGVVVPEFY